ncbi:DUF6376 family protein [Niallia sp. 01092]|uniref:DUF6376 family protein n=1 Tax=unclassified Niallia TaxID=2837522 RepID=UPI003FD521C9
MKKWLLAIPMIMLLLAACSPLEDTKNTLTYIDEATKYVNEANQFANDLPALTEKAVTDEQAAQELEAKLKDFQENIQNFNKLEPPSMMQDLHEQIVEQNNKLEKGITVYLDNIENGKLKKEVLENNELVQSIQEIQSIYKQIKELGE